MVDVKVNDELVDLVAGFVGFGEEGTDRALAPVIDWFVVSQDQGRTDPNEQKLSPSLA